LYIYPLNQINKKMKKLLALFCLFSLLTAFTCENEPLEGDIETNFENTDDDLLGEWSLVEFSSSISTVTDFSGQLIESDIDIESTTVDYTLNFTANNYTTSGSYSYVADVVANGFEVTGEPYTLENVSGSGSYSTNGNEMTVDGAFFEFELDGMVETGVFDEEQTAPYQISDDGQTLTFTQNETTTQTDDATGTVITIDNNSISVWSKQ